MNIVVGSFFLFEKMFSINRITKLRKKNHAAFLLKIQYASLWDRL